MKKVVAVNFVAKHSYLFVRRMIEGFILNDCYVFAIVSKNMPEIDEWRNLDNTELFEVDGYQSVADFPMKLLKFIRKDAKAINKRIDELSPSCMYLPIFTYWSLPIVKSLRKIPIIYAMHDPETHEKKRIVARYMNSQLGRRAKYIVILSEVFREFVKRKCHKDDAHVITVPSGHENEETRGTPLIHYDDNKTNYLFQGRIDKYKGLEILAKSYAKLYKENDNITLTVAGSGDFSPYAKIYDKLPNCTVINRWLTNEEVRGLFNDKSVITVLPYLSATQSGVINVAMPCGSPIIATKCGGIIEQITDNETGYLANPGDVEDFYLKMKYVAENKDDWNRIRENGYRRMEALSWEALSKKIVDIM